MEPIDTPEGLLVYADWLLSQGKPQGELISLQRARAERRGTAAHQRALRLREAELIAKHSAEMVGGLPERSRVAWRMGFARELSVVLQHEDLSTLGELLRRPALALLEVLEVEVHALKSDLPPIAEVISQQLAAAAPKRLRAFRLKHGGQEGQLLEGLLASIPGIERLAIETPRAHVSILGAQLPALVELELNCDAFDILWREELPKLERVRLRNVVLGGNHYESLREGGLKNLELHVEDEGTSGVTELRQHRRVVLTMPEEGEHPGEPFVVRTAHEAGERAFVLLDAPKLELARALERLKKLPVDGSLLGAARSWKLGGHPVGAVELRCNEPQPSLLRNFAVDLAAVLQRGVIEVAVSESTHSALFRAHEPLSGNVTSWVLAKTRSAEAPEALRRAVDRVLGFDPGLAAFDDVCLELDGAEPMHLRGEPPKGPRQLPCCTPIEPDMRTYEADRDEYDWDDGDDEDDSGEHREPEPGYEDEFYGPQPSFDEPPRTVQVVEALLEAEEAAAEDEDVDDEPFRDAADVTIEELLTESPVDPEEDGLEPDVEKGLEAPPDLEGLQAVVVCEVCRRVEALETCQRCGAEICEGCMPVELPPTCSECRGVAGEPTAPSRKTIAPAPSNRSQP